jgi:transposase
MSRTGYPADFKKEAVKQVVERGQSASAVAARLGITSKSMYAWIKKAQQEKDRPAGEDLRAENARLRAQLKQATEERDILKKAAAYFAKQSA